MSRDDPVADQADTGEHHEGCWREHPGCAVAHVEKLEGAIAEWRSIAVRWERDERARTAERDRLLSVIGMDSPWPLHDVIGKLVEATEHMLADHDCDCHGHEEFQIAARRGRELREAIMAALAPGRDGLAQPV